MGRDILSRIMFGARTSLIVGVGAVVLGIGVGAVLGLISGFGPAWLDGLVQRLMDAVLAFPTLILALSLASMLGASLRNLIIAIGISLIPRAARVIRSVVLILKHEPYIEAARAIGCSDTRIAFRHLLRNAVGPIMVLAAGSVGSAIVTEAVLSFVGVGLPPSTPSWGQMITGSARTYITTAPWIAFFPGAVLSLLVLAINIGGDALVAILDPRLRRAN